MTRTSQGKGKQLKGLPPLRVKAYFSAEQSIQNSLLQLMGPLERQVRRVCDISETWREFGQDEKQTETTNQIANLRKDLTMQLHMAEGTFGGQFPLPRLIGAPIFTDISTFDDFEITL